MGRKIRVYVAGPVRRGDLLNNLKQADEAFYKLMKTGMFAPMVPHWTCYTGGCQPAVGQYESVWARANKDGHYPDLNAVDFIEADLAWVRVSEAVLRLPGESVEADQEVECAKECGIPVFHTADLLIEWGKEVLRVEELQRVSFGWREAGR